MATERLNDSSLRQPITRAGNLAIDIEARQAWLGERPLPLTTQEFDLLVVLLRWQNTIMPHTTICQAMWGSAGSKELKRLGVVISNLRDKLDGISPYVIETVRSRGYGLVLGEASRDTTVTADPVGVHDWHSHQYAHAWIDAQREEDRSYLRRLVHLLPFDPDDAIRVLDIGAGYGAMTKLVLDAYPHSTVVVHDYSEPMLMEARLRLGGASDHVSYARGDLQCRNWTSDLTGQFDAVISSVAIHNVRYPRRIQAIFREVHALLRPGGCFYDVDFVAPAGDLAAEARRHALLMDCRTRRRQETGRWPALRELEPQVDVSRQPQMAEQEGEVAEPASLSNQMRWLSEAGFSQVECFWHDGRRALMGAFKA